MDGWTPYLFFGGVAALGLVNFAWGLLTGMPVSDWLAQKHRKRRSAPGLDRE